MANLKQYRHKRSAIIAVYDSRNFYQHSTNPDMKIPVVVVEGSTEWEEIVPPKPVIDFYGTELDAKLLHYKVLLLKDNTTMVSNGLGNGPEESKVLTAFKDYDEACEFQRIYVFLKKQKELLTTAGGNASQYLKNLLKTL